MSLGCTNKGNPEKVAIHYEQQLSETQQYDYVTKYFKDFIDVSKIGKEQITGDENATEYFTTYLGTIQLNEINYHAISQFYSVKKDAVKESYSRIIFLDSNIIVVKLYKISRPEELPIAIHFNKLVFDIDSNKYNVSLGDKFPRLICVDDLTCL